MDTAWHTTQRAASWWVLAGVYKAYVSWMYRCRHLLYRKGEHEHYLSQHWQSLLRGTFESPDGSCLAMQTHAHLVLWCELGFGLQRSYVIQPPRLPPDYAHCRKSRPHLLCWSLLSCRSKCRVTQPSASSLHRITMCTQIPSWAMRHQHAQRQHRRARPKQQQQLVSLLLR